MAARQGNAAMATTESRWQRQHQHRWCEKQRICQLNSLCLGRHSREAITHVDQLLFGRVFLSPSNTPTCRLDSELWGNLHCTDYTKTPFNNWSAVWFSLFLFNWHHLHPTQLRPAFYASIDLVILVENTHELLESLQEWSETFKKDLQEINLDKIKIMWVDKCLGDFLTWRIPSIYQAFVRWCEWMRKATNHDRQITTDGHISRELKGKIIKERLVCSVHRSILPSKGLY